MDTYVVSGHGDEITFLLDCIPKAYFELEKVAGFCPNSIL